MQIAATPDYDTIAALDQMKRSVRMAFCGVMQSTRLPPMAALSLAATAVGLLYLEVAAAHHGDDSCPCGWAPRSAADLGLSVDTGHLELLTHDREGTLMRSLGEFPRVLKTAASLREPHRVCRYLEDLAGDYHRFYDSCRVLPQGDEQPNDLNAARLALCAATRQVIANGLGILGVSAPERM